MRLDFFRMLGAWASVGILVVAAVFVGVLVFMSMIVAPRIWKKTTWKSTSGETAANHGRFSSGPS